MKKGDSLLENPIQLVRWILKTLCIPVALPWALFQAFRNMQIRKKRACLQDKVVIITGASSGIGEAIAHKFYAEGCRLVLASRRVDELNRVKSDLLRTHSTVPTHIPIIMPLDLIDIDSFPGIINKVLDVYGQIDILINNGGVSFRGNVLSTSLDVDMKIMNINYFGQVALTKAVVPHMIKRQSGHVVFVSSIQGRIVLPCRSAYGASKHALQAFSDILRAEVDKENVKVLTVSPSYVNTSLSLNALTYNGNAYGVTDNSTSKGYDPELVAEKMINALVSGDKEVLIAPFYHKFFIFLRTFLSSAYFRILVKFEKDMSKNI